MSNDRLPAARLRLGLTQQQVADTVARVLEEPVDAKYVGRLERGHVTWPRAKAFSESEQRSPLVQRTYDLRHEQT